METKFKVGQKVFDLRRGEGVIESIDKSGIYIISVEFKNFSKASYTVEGKSWTLDVYPSLYESNPFENQFRERVMWVSHDCADWKKRVVFFNKNREWLAWQMVETIEEAANRTNVVTWRYAKEIEPELEIVELEKVVLTFEDISAGKGVGIPPHLIYIKK